MGSGQVYRARRCVLVCTVLAVLLLVLLGLVVVTFPRALGSIFSDDPAVIDLFEEVRVP